MPIAADALRVEEKFVSNQKEKSNEPINVFDLPQLYTKPSFTTLSTTLTSLKLKVSSWSTAETISPKEDSKAIATYLTKIISSPLHWLSEDEQEEIWEEAAARLAERSGRSGMGAITRTFTIPSSNLNEQPDLAISIHEPSLTGDNLGLKTWGSAFLMAQKLIQIRHDYHSHLVPKPSVLELGSGTGLAGMVAAALWGTHVALTDLPEIVQNLERNARANEDEIEERGGSVEVSALDWSDVGLGHGSYDVVLAVDPLYSDKHPALLAPAIDGCLARREEARVLVGFPLRDKATEAMGEDLKRRLDERGFELVGHGDEYGYDDWEVNGERVKVHTWWGVWKRRGVSIEC